jgi:hypothetical protein
MRMLPDVHQQGRRRGSGDALAPVLSPEPIAELAGLLLRACARDDADPAGDGTINRDAEMQPGHGAGAATATVRRIVVGVGMRESGQQVAPDDPAAHGFSRLVDFSVDR